MAYGNSFVINSSGLVIPQLAATKAYFYRGTIGAVIIPAVAGMRFFLKTVTINVDSNATIAVAGSFDVILTDGSATLLENDVYLGTVASTANGIIVANLSGLDYISTGMYQALSVATNVALVTGNMNITVFGGYTSATP